MKLKHKKTTQDSGIPVKVLKENADFFAEYLYIFFNEATESSVSFFVETSQYYASFQKR